MTVLTTPAQPGRGNRRRRCPGPSWPREGLVFATASRLGGGIIATGDPDDLRSLAGKHPSIKVQPLSRELRTVRPASAATGGGRSAGQR